MTQKSLSSTPYGEEQMKAGINAILYWFVKKHYKKVEWQSINATQWTREATTFHLTPKKKYFSFDEWWIILSDHND